MRTSGKFAIAGLLLLLGAPLMGATEKAYIWADRSSGGLISLAYGPSNPAENPLFLLSCFNEMDVAVLDVHREVDGGSPGQPLTIEVASKQRQAPVKGEVAKNDATGTTFGEAAGIEITPLLEVLREQGPLTLTMGRTSATLPDEGRAEAVSRFSQGCKVR